MANKNRKGNNNTTEKERQQVNTNQEASTDTAPKQDANSEDSTEKTEKKFDPIGKIKGWIAKINWKTILVWILKGLGLIALTTLSFISGWFFKDIQSDPDDLSDGEDASSCPDEVTETSDDESGPAEE